MAILNFNRVEKKYLLNENKYDALMLRLSPYIEQDEYPISTTSTIYYDTPDFKAVRYSYTKTAFREKLRIRTYDSIPSESSQCFIELKKKFQGIVYKRRIYDSLKNATDYLKGNKYIIPHSQIREEIDYHITRMKKLQPAVFMYYDRNSFKDNETGAVRITFDRNIVYRNYDLEFTKGNHGTRIINTDEVLMEIKVPGPYPLWLVNALSELEIYPQSFSKYKSAYESLRKKGEIIFTWIIYLIVFNASPEGAMTIWSFLSSFFAAVILGVGSAYAYKFKNVYNKDFIFTLAILPPIVSVVISLVNGNVGAGIAVLGAFSLIRFRSAPGGAREISAIFISMAIGLATGMGYLLFATAFTVLISIVSVIFVQFRFGQMSGSMKQLTIVVPEDLDYYNTFDDIFEKYTSSVELFNIRSTDMGSLFRLKYIITVNDEAEEKQMIDEIRTRNGNLDVDLNRYVRREQEL